MTKIQPFKIGMDDFDNCRYEFTWVGSNTEKYMVEIIIDELDDDILVTKKDDIGIPRTRCQCKDFCCRQKEGFHECKHIKMSKDILKEFGVVWREND